jgi:hypothetical protein
MTTADEVLVTIRDGGTVTVEFNCERHGPLDDRDLIDRRVCSCPFTTGTVRVNMGSAREAQE